jgi:hypothetical protein
MLPMQKINLLVTRGALTVLDLNMSLDSGYDDAIDCPFRLIVASQRAVFFSQSRKRELNG